jgi:very-short-patch-repair endonuclease
MEDLTSSLDVVMKAVEQGTDLDDASPLEGRLLEALRRLGLEPTRQHPAGIYRLDFYFPDEKLCVEVDGKHHANIGRPQRDRRRDEHLAKDGIHTMRLLGTEVHRDADWCARRVRWKLGELRGEPVFETRRAIYGDA